MEILQQLRRKLIGEELDYSFLMNFLQDYSKPRDKITRYLKNGDLIRVKKGLYVLGDLYRKQLICLEVLANLIYGPSYISLEYALSFYGFIPERVECVTSITTQKNKYFHTPLGAFSYQHISPHKYQEGVIQLTLDNKRYFIIASVEKAIADILERQKSLTLIKDLKEFFLDDLRIPEFQLKKLNIRNLAKIAKVYDNPSIGLLLNWVKS